MSQPILIFIKMQGKNSKTKVTIIGASKSMLLFILSIFWFLLPNLVSLLSFCMNFVRDQGFEVFRIYMESSFMGHGSCSNHGVYYNLNFDSLFC